jgi:hypothetical protein
MEKNIANAVKHGKKAFRDWKEAGKPNDEDKPLWLTRKECKKNLGKQIAIAIWSITDNLHQYIASAYKQDSKLFHRLINQQRKTASCATSEIWVNGTCMDDPESIGDAFKSHFAGLAQPTDNEKFDKQYQQTTHFDSLVVKDLCKKYPSEIRPTTPAEVKKVIHSLNSGKAPDNCGITAEHMKHAGETLISTISTLINKILKLKIVPRTMKEGILTPIEKRERIEPKLTVIEESLCSRY